MSYTLILPQPAADSLPRGLAVITRYAGPTDSKGSRIIATCKRDADTTYRAVVGYNHSGGCLDAHYLGALACLRKIEEQNGVFAFTFQAVASTADGYVFVTAAHDRGAS